MYDNENFEEVRLGDKNSGTPREVDILKSLNRFLEIYERLFKSRYGALPIRVRDDEEIARWAAVKLTGGTAEILLIAYFSLDGDDGWFTKQAHSLHCFKQNINKIVANSTNKQKSPYFVVGISEENGFPVLDRNPHVLKDVPGYDFEPVLFEEWKKTHGSKENPA